MLISQFTVRTAIIINWESCGLLMSACHFSVKYHICDENRNCYAAWRSPRCLNDESLARRVLHVNTPNESPVSVFAVEFSF